MPWPFQPVHRFFPHFNHLSDDEARIEVRRVARGLRREIIGESIVVGLLVGFLATIALSCLVTVPLMPVSFRTPFSTIALWFLISVVLAAAGLCGYLAAVRHHNARLRLLLTNRLPPPPTGTARCSHCAYPLVQLPESTGGTVRCPECGTETRLLP